MLHKKRLGPEQIKKVIQKADDEIKNGLTKTVISLGTYLNEPEILIQGINPKQIEHYSSTQELVIIGSNDQRNMLTL